MPIIVGDIEWCKTNRGNDRIYRGCRAVVYVSIDSNIYKDSNNVEHNHLPNHHNVKRLLVLQKVKERVMTEPTSVTRIIEDEYVKNNLNDGDRQYFLLPTAQDKQSSKFYKIRAKTLPPDPKSLDFDVPESYSKTYSGEQFLIYDSTQEKLGG
ncbi:unnamed protein product [Rotaria sordida]|uniref:FLYWCH-type domain-containing protein n=1 Tax=Rotaria sordida TaxID=392033 RepID=A0A814CUX8_9BILA|nr:unnamed protein product [Rotaria sordida]CAF1064914.1 unnamed protein product [Rotaria sordida]CAF1240984.1 unnamed protein product [Rotaria sordida]CAF3798096.1 unnamed protein product [Rotaria sordida]CAF3896520.1 unnamed protein product [Rotaria sordida]